MDADGCLMTIVTSNYQPKRARRKKTPRSYPANMPLIVTPGPMKKRRGPVIRLSEQMANDKGQEQPRRSAIVEPKTKRHRLFGDMPDMTEEEHRRAGEKAQELFREIKRRIAAAKHD